MEPELWRDVERLYHAALDRAPEERAGFLGSADADEVVKREVESLLGHEQAGDRLLENLPWQLQPSLPIGSSLGPYRILAAIGAGGMGEVYRAHDSKLGRDVAIKALPYEFARDGERLARLRREARTLASLNHPCIAAIYGLETGEAGECLVLELVEGEPLRGPLPLAVALERAGQVAEALEAAHARGIIHRDLKPANIKVTAEGRVKVLDFGLAKALWGKDEDPESPAAAATAGLDTIGGRILGTPGYMSPEQTLGRNCDERTDVWAFGSLLFELLSGKRAFEGATVQETIVAIMEREPDWQVLPPKTPARLRELLRKCLEKDVSRRPSSMAEIRVAVQRARQGSGYRRMAAVAAVALLAAVLATGPWRRSRPIRVSDLSQWTQLTNFADSAAAPVLSRDGKTVAFFRSSAWFASPGAIYKKSLPDGDAVLVANDGRNKYGLAFSPDGSQIAYTVWDNAAKFQWQTYTVPVSGGQPRLMFMNAGGLTWLDEHRLLYSEVRTGLHMGVVTSNLSRTDRREIYFPEYERRMAHYSFASPDRKWALVAEMEPVWLPCRIIPLDGSSSGRRVGPPGPCNAAGWSPDGKWMYFAAEVNGGRHLWRQAFPRGAPEEITFGPTEEEGLAVTPDGASLITSVGIRQSAVWLHDANGERAISAEGFAAANYLALSEPLFSRDGHQVYYLLSRQSPGSANELWRTNLDTLASECIVRGFRVMDFDISDAATAHGTVVFSSQPTGRPQEIWLAPLDRSAPPKRLTAAGESWPHLGPDGTVWFLYSDGKENFAGLMKRDGSGRRQVSPRPISTVTGSSPDGNWLVAMAPSKDQTAIDTIAIPSQAGGVPRMIGRGRFSVAWSPDGRFVYVGCGANQTVVLPVSPGQLPELPEGGIRSCELATTFPGARRINASEISPGPDPSTFAYVKSTTHRNLFRISLQ
ncbi:MAG: serine/threonine-protein kinase [Acidobacteria bacterium]|nr:serine/threonine-protein kinase [Acidobacteriota bacterium]